MSGTSSFVCDIDEKILKQKKKIENFIIFLFFNIKNKKLTHEKKNKAVWGTRFNNATSKIFEQIGASIDIDKRLFEEDILGSIVHTQMLIKQKIIKNKKGKKIINGFKKIRTEIKKINSFLIKNMKIFI